MTSDRSNEEMSDVIPIWVPSETVPLQTVVMGLSKSVDRERVLADMRADPPDEGSRYQHDRNRWEWAEPRRARAQQLALADVLERHGAQVLFVDNLEDVAIPVFPRDIGFAIDDVFFLARSRLASRCREQRGLGTLLPRLSRIAELDDGIIEGGDVLVSEREVIVGLGEETDRPGVDALRRKLEELGSGREVVALEMAHRGVIHLDTKFNIVAPELAIFEPTAFTAESCRFLESRFELIACTPEEAYELELNVVSLGTHVIVLERSVRISGELAARGIEPLLVDYSEVTRMPGGIRCSLLPLVRQK